MVQYELIIIRWLLSKTSTNLSVWTCFIHKIQSLLGYWKCNINTNPFYNPQLSVNPYQKCKFDKSERSKCCFCKWKCAEYWTISFVKTNKLDAKIDYFYQISNKSILMLLLEILFCFQSYNSSILQFFRIIRWIQLSKRPIKWCALPI
jgi:hypothetical protein